MVHIYPTTSFKCDLFQFIQQIAKMDINGIKKFKKHNPTTCQMHVKYWLKKYVEKYIMQTKTIKKVEVRHEEHFTMLKWLTY